MAAPRSQEIIQAVQTGLDQGKILRVIGEEAGISRSAVQRMLAEGVVVDTRGSLSPQARSPRIPPWVPSDLRADYFDNCRLYGDIHAARLARAAKAEALQMGA